MVKIVQSLDALSWKVYVVQVVQIVNTQVNKQCDFGVVYASV